MSDSIEHSGSTLLEVIETLAERRPASPAILTPGRPRLTYQELGVVVSEFRRNLSSRGIGSQDRVALLLDDGPEMAVSFLATAAHCCATPLNPAFGAEELAFSLSDLGVSAVIVQQNRNEVVRTVASRLGIPVLDLIADAAQPAGTIAIEGVGDSPADPVMDSPVLEDTALVLHTSGTTAKPKIVPLTQRNLYASARAIAGSLALTDRDRGLVVMPLFHIHGLVAGILAPLHAGGSIVCPPGFDPDGFFDCIAAYQPSWFTAVPTIHRGILEAGKRRDFLAGSHSFRFLRSSSSPLPPKLMADMSAFFAVPVVEAYGMTEASHQISVNPIDPGRQRPGSVGIPASTEVRVVDSEGQTRPVGGLGEVVIRGENVMRAYQAAAAINAEAFFADWFRTGDEGRFDEQGYLYLTGRLKEIINRGGEKVSPREVDDALSEFAGVRQAATFPVPHETLGEDVLAAVVTNADADIDEATLRRHCFDHLADFKVPTRIVIVDTIPTGATGKIQRFALAERLADALKVEFHVAANRVEALLAGMVEEVTGAERVGASDNFFALGGDSIRGLQLVARIQSALQIELSPVAVFRHPTVRELAREVEHVAEEAFGGSLEDLLIEIEGLSDEEAEALASHDGHPV